MIEMKVSEFTAYVKEQIEAAVLAEREACIDDVRCVGGTFAIKAEQFIRARGLTKSNTGE